MRMRLIHTICILIGTLAGGVASTANSMQAMAKTEPAPVALQVGSNEPAMDQPLLSPSMATVPQPMVVANRGAGPPLYVAPAVNRVESAYGERGGPFPARGASTEWKSNLTAVAGLAIGFIAVFRRMRRR